MLESARLRRHGGKAPARARARAVVSAGVPAATFAAALRCSKLIRPGFPVILLAIAQVLLILGLPLAGHCDGLPVPPPGYQPGDAVPADSKGETEEAAAADEAAAQQQPSEGDDAAALEVKPDSESRELAAGNNEPGTELQALSAQSATQLEQRATEVLDAAQAELAALKARLPGLEDLRPVSKDSPDFPDNFSAGSVFTDKRGLLYAGGGVRMALRSLLPQGEALVEADDAIYDTDSGVIELSGKVRLSVNGLNFDALAAGAGIGGASKVAGNSAGFDPRYFGPDMGKSGSITADGAGSLAFECDWLRIDSNMRELQVRGLRVHISLEELLGPEAVKELPLRTDFRNHILPSSPDEVWLSSDAVYFAEDRDTVALLMHEVKVSLGANPDPDLFITARDCELVDEQQIMLSDVQLHISGFDWVRWPRLSRSLKKSPSVFNLDTPQFQVDREFGVALKQGANIDLGMFKTEALLDYSPEYGMLAKAYAYFEPVTDTQLGVQVGRSTQSNIERNTVQRRDDYNFVYRQSLSPGGTISKLHLGAQYGHLHERVDGRPSAGIPDRVAEDTRMMADMDMQLTPLDLGGDLFLTLGARARYIRYQDNDLDYTVLGGRAGLVWRHHNFDHFILYRYNNTSGDALFSLDEVRREQLDFATSLQTLPSWRNVLRGSYDPLDEEFDRLQLGTFKQQKSYEMGVYWDFARESAEVEFGLRFE